MPSAGGSQPAHGFMAKKITVCVPDFNPIGHIYTRPHDGMRLDSVTTIIKEECGLYQYGDGLAAERGTAVHLACQFYDEGDLKEDTLADNIRPYFEQYKLALETLKIKVLANELRRYHSTYLYAGTLDKLADVDGQIGVIDLKTGQESIDHKWQLAAYVDMIKHEHPDKTLSRWNLYLRPDSFKLVEHSGLFDFREFLTLYAAHNLKLNYGFRKRKEEDMDYE